MRGKPKRGEDEEGVGEREDREDREDKGKTVGLRRMEGGVLRAVDWAARRRWEPLDLRLNSASTSKFGSFK